jgi:hypothetical protein
VAINWSLHAGGSGPTATNVIHVYKAASGTNAIAVAVDANVVQTMWGSVSDTFSVGNIVVTKLDGLSASYTFATGRPAKWKGNQTGDYIPQGAALVKLQTALRGRSYRGRVFTPFVAEGGQTAGQLTASNVTNTQNGWDAFHAAMTAAGFTFVVASYKHAIQNPVSTIFAEQPMATIRKRMSRLR